MAPMAAYTIYEGPSEPKMRNQKKDPYLAETIRRTEMLGTWRGVCDQDVHATYENTESVDATMRS